MITNKNIKRMFESDGEEGLKQCSVLLDHPDLSSSPVRYGDVYALIIEHYVSQQQFDKVIIYF